MPCPDAPPRTAHIVLETAALTARAAAVAAAVAAAAAVCHGRSSIHLLKVLAHRLKPFLQGRRRKPAPYAKRHGWVAQTGIYLFLAETDGGIALHFFLPLQIKICIGIQRTVISIGVQGGCAHAEPTWCVG